MFPRGEASIQHIDTNAKRGIDSVTFPDGRASVRHLDTNGKRRISTVTFPGGVARIDVTDARGDNAARLPSFALAGLDRLLQGPVDVHPGVRVPEVIRSVTRFGS